MIDFMQFCGSMTFSRYGSGSGSCCFRQWPLRWQAKKTFFYFLKLHLHHFSKIKSQKEEWTLRIFRNSNFIGVDASWNLMFETEAFWSVDRFPLTWNGPDLVGILLVIATKVILIFQCCVIGTVGTVFFFCFSGTGTVIKWNRKRCCDKFLGMNTASVNIKKARFFLQKCFAGTVP